MKNNINLVMKNLASSSMPNHFLQSVNILLLPPKNKSIVI